MKAFAAVLAIMALGAFNAAASPALPDATINSVTAAGLRGDEQPAQSVIKRQKTAEKCQDQGTSCYPVDNCCPGLSCKFDRSGTRRTCYPPGQGED